MNQPQRHGLASGISFFGFLISSFLLSLSVSFAVNAKEVLTVEQALIKCRDTYPSQFESKKRLACFDSISTPSIEIKASESLINNTNSASNENNNVAAENAPKEIKPAKEKPVAIAVKKTNADLTYLERKWRLTSEGDWNINDFEIYKSNYLIFSHTNNTNNTPQSPNRLNTEDRNLDAEDLKFQLSLKTELYNNIPLIRNLPFVTSSRLWGAYTQKSNWQIFDANASRPLRENNYEPELILSLGIDNEVDGVKKDYIPRMLNLGVVHQSNGRSNPTSRSWNRVYLESGWELTDRISLMVRPWWRLPEDGKKDDNPDIEKFMGYGDVTVRYETPSGKTALSVLMRNNLRSDNKGFAQIDLQQRVFNNPYIKLHMMYSSGYGDTLLDYNHSQNIFGFGISLGE
ncbi:MULTISPECIES: phospholipase A [Methylotenera]|uniref:phospholipase A n=1 Tax=Methylotenera TaxID=359407 RepID=UPI000367AF61|nr:MULTISPECIES: phospholipase A [Methylotenera]